MGQAGSLPGCRAARHNKAAESCTVADTYAVARPRPTLLLLTSLAGASSLSSLEFAYAR